MPLQASWPAPEVTMNTDKILDGPKRPYVRPVLEVIDLVAEEVLGIGCKSSSGGLAVSFTPCTNGGCVGEGS